MGKFYCDYCDRYLTHDSFGGRKQHNRGKKHKDNVIVYYSDLIRRHPELVFATGAPPMPPQLPSFPGAPMPPPFAPPPSFSGAPMPPPFAPPPSFAARPPMPPPFAAPLSFGARHPMPPSYNRR